MSFWQGIERPTRPASTPYTNEQLKAAFFALLEDSQEKISEYSPAYSCCPHCPLFDGNECSVHACDDDAAQNICREEILKWYVEKANERFKD